MIDWGLMPFSTISELYHGGCNWLVFHIDLAHWWKTNDACRIDFCQSSERKLVDPGTFGGKDCSSFHYSQIRQNSPAPWWPCFLTNQHSLKEPDRGSCKEHFYKII